MHFLLEGTLAALPLLPTFDRWEFSRREREKKKQTTTLNCAGKVFSPGRKKKTKVKSSADIPPPPFLIRSVSCCCFTHQGKRRWGGGEGGRGLEGVKTGEAAPGKIKCHVHTSALYRANKKHFFFSSRLERRKFTTTVHSRVHPLENKSRCRFFRQQVHCKIMIKKKPQQNSNLKEQGHTRCATFVTLSEETIISSSSPCASIVAVLAFLLQTSIQSSSRPPPHHHLLTSSSPFEQ